MRLFKPKHGRETEPSKKRSVANRKRNYAVKKDVQESKDFKLRNGECIKC